MSERPNIVLSVLLAVAATIAVGIATGIVLIPHCDIPGLAGAVVGRLTGCLVFFHQTEVVPLAALVIATLALLSLIALAWVTVQVVQEQRLLRLLPLVDRVTPLTDAADLPPVLVLPTQRPTAFCAGLLRPTIVVSDSLAARLSSDELAAAIWHEANHARGREPLKSFVARAAVGAFFWLPALRDLLDRYLLTRELAADRQAIARTSPAALAGALYAVATERPFRGTVGLTNYAAARVDRLFDPNSTLPPLFDRHRLRATILSGASIALMLAIPAVVSVEWLHALKPLSKLATKIL